MLSEAAWLSILQFIVSPLILLIVGAVLNRRIKETKKEITNSHPMHLRDDLDKKFKLVFARQDTIVNELKQLDQKLDERHDDITQLYDTVADHEKRLTGQATKLRRVSSGK